MKTKTILWRIFLFVPSIVTWALIAVVYFLMFLLEKFVFLDDVIEFIENKCEL